MCFCLIIIIEQLVSITTYSVHTFLLLLRKWSTRTAKKSPCLCQCSLNCTSVRDQKSLATNPFTYTIMCMYVLDGRSVNLGSGSRLPLRDGYTLKTYTPFRTFILTNSSMYTTCMYTTLTVIHAHYICVRTSETKCRLLVLSSLREGISRTVILAGIWPCSGTQYARL